MILKTVLKEDEGFTFIETIITITIILILSAAVGFSSIKYVERAKVAACRNQIETFRLALQSYFLDCGHYPTETQSLEALWEKPVLSPIPASWNGPYVDRQIPKDPWGNDYVYKNPGEKNLPFTIMSHGSGVRSGGGETSDEINSWD
jgi:general secretion pathway protein G